MQFMKLMKAGFINNMKRLKGRKRNVLEKIMVLF